MSAFFEEWLGLEPEGQRQAIMLTVLCTIFPIVQLFILLVVMGCHPTIDNDQGDTVQNLEATKEEFKKMVKCVFLNCPNKHHESIENWLSITTLNANNYSQQQRANNAIDDTESQDTTDSPEQSQNNPVPNRAKNDTESQNTDSPPAQSQNKEQKIDGRKVFLMKFDSETLIAEGRGETNPPSYLTPMMKIINYHVKIMYWTGILEQVNIGMEMSEETKLRKKRLPWRGAVDILRTIDDKPRFPSALNYSVVRALKDKTDWDYADKGTRLDPQTLSEKPWLQISQKANSFMRSFLIDVFLHWFTKVWFPLVLIKIIIS
jgi:hypothetical protein